MHDVAAALMSEAQHLAAPPGREEQPLPPHSPHDAAQQIVSPAWDALRPLAHVGSDAAEAQPARHRKANASTEAFIVVRYNKERRPVKCSPDDAAQAIRARARFGCFEQDLCWEHLDPLRRRLSGAQLIPKCY